MTKRAPLHGLLVLLVAACSRGDELDRSSAQTDSGAAAGARSDVELAAAVARAIDAAPGKADSIIAAHGLTIERLDSLMYVIAADSAKTAAYEAARREPAR